MRKRNKRDGQWLMEGQLGNQAARHAVDAQRESAK